MSSDRSSQPFAAFFGIDRSDQVIDSTCLDSSGQHAGYQRVSTKPAALKEWLYAQREAFPSGPLAICIEQPCANLSAFFSQFDFVVLFLINPVTLKRWREAFQVSKAKDDRNDSCHLAQLVFERHSHFKPWRPQDADTRLLRRLCEGRRALINQRTQLTNRLKAVLKDYFPLALEVSGEEIHANLACRFLSKWSCLASLQRAKAETIRAFYYKMGSRRPKTIERRLEEIAAAVPLTEDPAIVRSSVLMVRALVKQLDALRAEIAVFEEEIDGLYASHPEHALFASIPGAGTTLGSRLLVVFGTNRDRFEEASAAQRFFGIAPVTKQSGRTRAVHRRRACPHFELQTFMEWVGQTIMKSTWSRACYDHLRAKGMRHYAALRTLAFKWIRIIFRCWKDRVPYDEATYIAALRKAGSPIVTRIDELLDVAHNSANNSSEITC